MHRNPRYFESLEEFKPERWDNDFEKQLPKGVYSLWRWLSSRLHW